MLSEVEACLWPQHKLRHRTRPSTSLRMLLVIENALIRKVLSHTQYIR